MSVVLHSLGLNLIRGFTAECRGRKEIEFAEMGEHPQHTITVRLTISKVQNADVPNAVPDRDGCR